MHDESSDAAGRTGRLHDNLQGEVDSAAVYRALAESERDPNLAAVYGRLAAVESAHAEFWRRRLGGAVAAAPSARARMLAWLARRLGAGFVLPSVAAAEARSAGHYGAQADAVAAGLPAAERTHARVVQAAAAAGRGLSGRSIALLEGRHRGMGGNALRAAVLGANDGLVSNLSLVMGMAGAGSEPRTILLTGLAGLIAGACSMALGEWLSVNSSRELYGAQIATEAAELAQSPEDEREELALIYQAKGLPPEQARALAEQLLGRPDTALDTLVREELGVDPDELGGSAWAAAGVSFALFAAGAAAPVVPFALAGGQDALAASIAASAAALAAIGAATSLFTGRGLAFSALRQLGIGAAAAALTWGIGRLAGVTLG